MFGHEKGAFTGAAQSKSGYFEDAADGTLFLDEIGDIPFSMQVKLLRVLQERKFTPVGSNREIRCDIRIIAATNQNLQQAIVDNKFREDLFYRLNVVPMRLPPLQFPLLKYTLAISTSGRPLGITRIFLILRSEVLLDLARRATNSPCKRQQGACRLSPWRAALKPANRDSLASGAQSI